MICASGGGASKLKIRRLESPSLKIVEAGIARCAQLVCSSRMSYKTVGVLGRALLQSGNRTPPLVRSRKLQNYSSKCGSCGVTNQEGKREEKSCKPCASGPPTSPAIHRHAVGGKKRIEEKMTLSGRSYSSTALKVDQRAYLWARYNEMKRLVQGMYPGLHFNCFMFCSNTWVV